MAVRTTSILRKWADNKAKQLDAGMLEVATDIHREAVILSPKDTRALANSGRIERAGEGHYKVIFGGSRVPYARRRHFENRKTPGSLRYLENPGNRIARNLKRYFS